MASIQYLLVSIIFFQMAPVTYTLLKLSYFHCKTLWKTNDYCLSNFKRENVKSSEGKCFHLLLWLCFKSPQTIKERTDWKNVLRLKFTSLWWIKISRKRIQGTATSISANEETESCSQTEESINSTWRGEKYKIGCIKQVFLVSPPRPIEKPLQNSKHVVQRNLQWPEMAEQRWGAPPALPSQADHNSKPLPVLGQQVFMTRLTF